MMLSDALMYYDVNISPSYSDMDMLEKSEYDGFCINTTMTSSEFERGGYELSRFEMKRSCYSRVEVEFEEGKQIHYDQRKAMRSDLFVVRLSGVDGLDKLIRLKPDMITFNYIDKIVGFKPGLIRTAIKEGIFFEIPLRPGLYESNVMWMRNVRRLLSITNGRNVVVSSGARYTTEIKKVRDIIGMLEMFGIRRKRAEDVMNNAGLLLRCCAMKRYCHKGAIVYGGEEGALKRDFILSRYE